MSLDTNLAGARLAGLEREVTWRQTTNYAAAVGDANPRYLDDSHPRGLVAPPLFATALTWPVMEKIQEQLAVPLPPEILLTMVHASEHLIFHRPVKPGDRLRLTGEIAAIFPRPAGAQLVLRLDAADRQEQPVFTEFAGSVFRGVPCHSQGRGRDKIPVLPPWRDAPAPLWEREIPIPRETPFIYDGCTNIVFAIHTSVSFARQVGLPDILLQGTATLALAAREILNREAGAEPERLREIACRFTGMVFPGSAIRLQVTHRQEADGDIRLGFQVLNHQGQPAIRDGFAKMSG